MSEPCVHSHEISDVTPSGDGCAECLETGDSWVHLRLCMHCGQVSCCNDSKNKHATAHWKAHPEHAIVQSFEPDEDWLWCYTDEVPLHLPEGIASRSYA